MGRPGLYEGSATCAMRSKRLRLGIGFSSNLSNMLLRRYVRTSDAAELDGDRARATGARRYPRRPSGPSQVQSNLADGLFWRFGLTGNDADLEEAIVRGPGRSSRWRPSTVLTAASSCPTSGRR